MEQINSRDALLNTQQAAEYLSLKPGTLEVWRSTKRYQLPYVLLGSRHVRYRQSALDAFIASNEVNA